MHHYPPLHPKSSPLFTVVPPLNSFQSVCRGLRWHRLFVCVSLLALVLHRDKGHCQCSHKKTLWLLVLLIFSHSSCRGTDQLHRPPPQQHMIRMEEECPLTPVHPDSHTYLQLPLCCDGTLQCFRFGTCEWIVNRCLWQYELVILFWIWISTVCSVYCDKNGVHVMYFMVCMKLVPSTKTTGASVLRNVSLVNNSINILDIYTFLL